MKIKTIYKKISPVREEWNYSTKGRVYYSISDAESEKWEHRGFVYEELPLVELDAIKEARIEQDDCRKGYMLGTFLGRSPEFGGKDYTEFYRSFVITDRKTLVDKLKENVEAQIERKILDYEAFKKATLERTVPENEVVVFELIRGEE